MGEMEEIRDGVEDTGRRPIVEPKECNGCGYCNICPHGAIVMNPSEEYGGLMPYFDNGKCTGCGKCVEACPEDVISMHFLRDEYTIPNCNCPFYGSQPDEHCIVCTHVGV